LLESRLPAFTRIVEFDGPWLEQVRIKGSGVRTLAGGQQFFKFEDMFPVIPEVVPIPDRIRPLRQVRRDRDLPAGEAGPFIRHLVIRYANALHPTGLRIDDDELVHVTVLPAHRILNRDVKVPERVPLGHLNPTPHQGIGLRKDDQKLVVFAISLFVVALSQPAFQPRRLMIASAADGCKRLLRSSN
jgi:hypothetical protein